MEPADKEIQDRAAAGHPSPPLDPALQQEIDTLLRVGRRIEAIKRLRERSPLGLKEAKDVIDQRAAQLGLPPLVPPPQMGERRAAQLGLPPLRIGLFIAIAAIVLLLVIFPHWPRVLKEILGPLFLLSIIYGWWLDIGSMLANRREAGRVLVGLGWSRDNWLASLFGVFAIVLAGSVVAIQGFKDPFDVGVNIFVGSFGIWFLVHGLSLRQIRENGVAEAGGFIFIAWEWIEAYQWAGEKDSTLILRLRLGRPRTRRWPVPPHQKASVDQILEKHVPGGHSG